MIVSTILSVLFFIWILRNILFWVWLWQVKEYRFDRLRVHLRETLQGRELFLSRRSLFKWFALIIYVPVVLIDGLVPYFGLLVLFLYAIEAYSVIVEIQTKTLRRPKFTMKTIGICMASFLFVLILFSIPLLNRAVWILILDRIATFFIACSVFVLSYPTELFYDFLIERARKKIKEHKKLLVIGITGSYGKSSTKEYIASILSKKFSVLKTRGTNNTRIGVAKNILSGLEKETEVFVVEMGAYKKGEIEEICTIVAPQIGVLTAVSPQHASLFGGIGNTTLTKYELIQALPKNALALFNGNNSVAFELYKKTEKRKVLYKLAKTLGEKADIKATHAIVSKYGISFTVEMGKRALRLKAPLIGVHNIENILPAVFLAWHFGIPDEDISDAVSQLAPLPHTMRQKKLPGGTVVIDSTYSANPQSFMTVFDYLRLYKGKRIVVMQPMIELGSHASLEHYKVGYHAQEVCDYLLLTNANFYRDIEKGITDALGKCVVKTGGTNALAQFIKTKITRGSSEDIVVFLGREAGLVLKKVI